MADSAEVVSLQATPETTSDDTNGAVDPSNIAPDLNRLMFSTDVRQLEHLTKQQMLDLMVAQARTLKRKRVKVRNVPDDGGDGDRCSSSGTPPRKQIAKSNADKFDFSRFMRRHIALKFLYLGWDYQGYCIQEDNEKTIEAALFDALIRTRLVESRETSNYHRCGRTDKGVSAFCQVITIDVRSNLREGPDLIRPENYDEDRGKHSDTELDYVGMLNRVLPLEIRVISWASVRSDLSARFDCRMRTYRYFFPRGRLDIEAMREAASHLQGERDFRNLCKMDVGNGVVEFSRFVERAWIEAPQRSEGDPNAMCCFCIRSNAFLWHQIRCIVAVLVLVGEGNEKPSIVEELLDIEKNPRKPQYSLASDVPLCLYEAEYDSIDWKYDANELAKVMDSLTRIWTMCSIKAAMIRSMISDLSTLTGYRPMNQAEPLLPLVKSKQHKPLMSRPKCESLENRVAYYEKRGRVMKWRAKPEDVTTSVEMTNPPEKPAASE